ncbi:MAG: hypothetical protein HKN43_16065 [Rhodothermales bacterium]|nr:hypothetical protein [Rhodothermales bacterium]
MSERSYNKIKAILAFFISIFGAMAILGVFFKIMKYDNYVLFMQIGFIGEAAAFITMGILELLGTTVKTAESASGISSGDITPKVQEAVVSTFVRAVEAKLDSQLDGMIGGLAAEFQQFTADMHALGAELNHSRASIQNMRNELDTVATGDLAGDAVRLGQGMSGLAKEMAVAGSTAESMRQNLEIMSDRFRQFNEGGVTSRATERLHHMARAENQ